MFISITAFPSPRFHCFRYRCGWFVGGVRKIKLNARINALRILFAPRVVSFRKEQRAMFLAQLPTACACCMWRVHLPELHLHFAHSSSAAFFSASFGEFKPETITLYDWLVVRLVAQRVKNRRTKWANAASMAGRERTKWTFEELGDEGAETRCITSPPAENHCVAMRRKAKNEPRMIYVPTILYHVRKLLEICSLSRWDKFTSLGLCQKS